MSGYIFCRLRQADLIAIESVPAPDGFAYFLVYNKNEYIGYLDRYGCLNPLGNTKSYHKALFRAAVTTVILLLLEWTSFFIAIITAIRMLWVGCKERKLLNVILKEMTKGHAYIPTQK